MGTTRSKTGTHRPTPLGFQGRDSAHAIVHAITAGRAHTANSRCLIPSYSTAPDTTIPIGRMNAWTKNGVSARSVRTRQFLLPHHRMFAHDATPTTTARVTTTGVWAMNHAGTYHQGSDAASTS